MKRRSSCRFPLHWRIVELFAVGSTAGFLIPYLADSLQLFLVRAVAEQNLVDGIHLVYGEAIAQDVAIIQQIVSQRQLQQELLCRRKS